MKRAVGRRRIRDVEPLHQRRRRRTWGRPDGWSEACESRDTGPLRGSQSLFRVGTPYSQGAGPTPAASFYVPAKTRAERPLSMVDQQGAQAEKLGDQPAGPRR